MRALRTPNFLTGAKPRIFFLTDGKPETRKGFRYLFPSVTFPCLTMVVARITSLNYS